MATVPVPRTWVTDETVDATTLNGVNGVNAVETVNSANNRGAHFR
jgi:hypothetical protein